MLIVAPANRCRKRETRPRARIIAMSKRSLAVSALLATVTIWGTTFVATKVALREMQPLTLSLARFALASLILVPLAVAEHRRKGGAVYWRQLAIAGFLGGFLYFALQNVGLAFTSASKASLILGSVPALTALLSVLVLRERVTSGRTLGILASVVGVSVIVLGQGTVGLDRGAMLGDLLVAGSALTWAMYTVQIKGIEGVASPVQLAAASVGFGGIFLLPFVGWEVAAQAPTVPGLSGWLAIGYLGFVASAAPFLFWSYGLRQVDASEAAVYVNLVPVVAVISAIAILGETVTPAAIAGGLIVLVGVWAAGRQSRETSAVEQAGNP